MTLLELSYEYKDHASMIALRIKELRSEIKDTKDLTEIHKLERRIAELRPLLQEARELAALTRHYYDRGYHKNDKYTL